MLLKVPFSGRDGLSSTCCTVTLLQLTVCLIFVRPPACDDSLTVQRSKSSDLQTTETLNWFSGKNVKGCDLSCNSKDLGKFTL